MIASHTSLVRHVRPIVCVTGAYRDFLPVISASVASMDLEDFRRLGVRPHECRLTVIRQAAMRSAGALAKQQLTSPSQQVGLQLSRVATSAYRLLDPRQRDDANHRVYVGRIMPNALHWAGQTSFYHPAGTRSLPFGSGSEDENELSEILDSEGSRSQSDAELWASQLNHSDLVGAKHRRIRRETVFMVALAGVAIGIVLGFATLGSRSPFQAASSVSPDVDPSPNASTPSTSDLRREDTGGATIDGQVSDRAVDDVANVDDVTNIKPSTPLPWDPDPFAAADPDSASSAPSELTQPTREDKSGGSESDGTMIAEAPSTIDQTRDESPAAERHPVPGNEGVHAGRERLIALLNDRDIAFPPRASDRPVTEIESLLPSLVPGSADDWAARVMMVELSWLVEDLTVVRAKVQSLHRAYDFTMDPLLADTFVSACDLAHLPETQSHLLKNGLRLADDFLVAESPQLCIRLVQALRPAAELLESESVLAYLDQFWHSALQMERLSSSSQRIIEQATRGEAEPQNAGIVGRYYCLMLRKWEIGMPWLAKASDPRIASVARQELSLQQASSVDDRVTLAQRWLSLADRLDGRSSDSIRLHAIDLLEQAAGDARELQKLEIERAIDEAYELLPPFLKAQPALTAPVVGPSDSPSAADPTEPVAKVKQGLSGRIRVGGRDIGVQLDYQLDVAFTQAVLDSIEQRLDRELPTMNIELVGDFQLKEPGRVLVSRAESPADVVQTIQIDDVPIGSPDGSSTEVRLEAGTHRVVWTIKAERFEQLYLRLRDAETGERLSVVQPSEMEVRSPRTVLTVAMVRGNQ